MANYNAIVNSTAEEIQEMKIMQYLAGIIK